jgi:hypothetical protein
VPKNDATEAVIAAATHEFPDGYSGWFTVSCGSQVVSGSVASLPSSSARWMAWTRRQAPRVVGHPIVRGQMHLADRNCAR